MRGADIIHQYPMLVGPFLGRARWMENKMTSKELRHWLILEFALVSFSLALQVLEGVKSISLKVMTPYQSPL